MKIVITAANGFIGKSLVAYLKKQHKVVALVRKKIDFGEGVEVHTWDGKTMGAWVNALEGSDVLINLAGKSVDCRYTDRNKAEIYASRLDSTKILAEAISSLKKKPELWMNAASATIYKHSLDTPMSEEKGIIGEGFSVDVCQQWERAFFAFDDPQVRQIALRTAIVLGKNGGVMEPFKRLVRFGLGGKMGKGNQQFSWIHELDFCRAVQFLIDQKQSTGVYNLAAPNPITNAYFMKTLRKTMGVKIAIPSPKFLLELGARLIKTETELILKSRFVIPQKLTASGFEFQFKEIESCLSNLLEK